MLLIYIYFEFCKCLKLNVCFNGANICFANLNSEITDYE